MKIDWIIHNKAKVIVIHYACGDLYDSGSPVRITHISCLKLQNLNSKGFSFIDKREQHPTFTDDQVEKALLDDFYQFVVNNKGKYWVHWNMRSSNYGFEAIEQRYRVLGGIPYHISESKTINLADLLKSIYGPNYAKNPKMYNIGRVNKILPKDFKIGAEEAKAFKDGRLRDISFSCNSKIRMFADILDLVGKGRLETPNLNIIDALKNVSSRIWWTLGAIGLIVGIVGGWPPFIAALKAWFKF